MSRSRHNPETAVAARHAPTRKDYPMKCHAGAFLPPEDRNLTQRFDHEELRAEFEELSLSMAGHFERVAASSAAALRELCDAILELFDAVETRS